MNSEIKTLEALLATFTRLRDEAQEQFQKAQADRNPYEVEHYSGRRIGIELAIYHVRQALERAGEADKKSK